MSWWKGDDRLALSVKVRGLADPGVIGDEAKRQRNEALGHWTQIISWVAGERTDGFVTADIVDLFGTPESTARLLRGRYERAPLLHQRGPDGKAPACACLDGRTWPADYEYLVHDYLDRNPSRSENDVHRAKKRELRDAKLKRAVRDRDQDLCRYCSKHCRYTDRVSDDGLTFDHVDPEIANGMDNLVVACRGCNNKKGRRTPQQAGMVLLDPPTTDLLTTGPATVVSPVVSPVTSPVTGPVISPDAAPGGNLSPDLRQDSAPTQVPRSPGRDGDGSAPAPQGISAAQTASTSTKVGPPDTPRPRSTSPYARQPRPAPENHAGVPAERDPARSDALCVDEIRRLRPDWPADEIRAALDTARDNGEAHLASRRSLLALARTPGTVLPPASGRRARRSP